MIADTVNKYDMDEKQCWGLSFFTAFFVA